MRNAQEYFMHRVKFIHAAGCAAIALGLAACDASQTTDSVIDPLAAQQLVAARADPDKALADKVKRALAVDSQPGAYGVEVTATDGTVQLWGKVASSAERKRFGLTAAGVVGVTALENRLQVDPGA
jgi:osmotically-inducible protein OsmY